MPDGTDTVITEQGGAVDAGTGQATDQTPPASTTVPAPSVSVQTPTPRSDPEARIRSLQSELDKTRAQRDQLTIEKGQLLTQVDTLKLQGANELAVNAEATRNAIARAETLSGENATLKSKLARLDYVLQKPHLMPYLSLLPETDDVTKLDAADAAITAARNQDIEQINQRVRTGAAVPPATPARPSGTLTADEMNRQLAEARLKGDSVAFNRLVEELAAKIPKG